METLQRVLRVLLGGEYASVLPARRDNAHYDDCIAVLIRSSEESQIDRLRSDGFASICEYAILPSMRNARWLIPLGKHCWTIAGLRVYTPYPIRARLLKRMIVSFAQVGYTGWARHKVLIASRQPSKLESLVREITGECNPVFALSLGTPGRFQKLTIQVMRPDGGLLCYVKLPMTPEAIGRIRHEAAMLELLRGCVALRTQIPQVLYSGHLGETYILFQSGGPSTAAPVAFGAIFEDFLQKLQSVQLIEKPGRALVEEAGAQWRKIDTKLDSTWTALGAAALLQASHELERLPVRCAVAHGDFAPWNCRISNGTLYVFDWEFSTAEVPIIWDAFHFHTQVASLLNRHAELPLHLQQYPGRRPLYLLYLLNSVARLLEEGGPQRCAALHYRQSCLVQALSCQ